jgi:coenzyme F420 hydrogenase subunit beta
MRDNSHNIGQQELLNEVLAANLCVGCGACVGLCPYQVSYNDKVAILFSCDIKTGRCYAFCPRTPTDLEALRKSLFNEAELTPEIGAIKGYYITRAVDKKVRTNAQHGGTVTTLIAMALQEGIIDRAIIVESRSNLLPQAAVVNDPLGVKNRGKSNFVVSPVVAEFNSTAKGEFRKIGVVATPCQTLALAKMRLKSATFDNTHIEKLKLVIGLFCGWAFSWREISNLLRKSTALDNIAGMDIPPSKYHTLEVYTKNGTISISLDEVNTCVREACRTCWDMTAEFSDISVGSARLPEGWEVSKNWNQVIVRTELGTQLMQLAKSRNVLEFKEIPKGNLERLKETSMNKKRAAVKHLIEKSRNAKNLIYLDHNDPVLRTLVP